MRHCDPSELSFTGDNQPLKALGVRIEAGLVDGGEGLPCGETAIFVIGPLTHGVKVVRPERVVLERRPGLGGVGATGS
jgi:hypothetical protein